MILTIDVQGMRKIKRRLLHKIQVVTFFLMPPSMRVLEKRLINRETDTKSEVRKRLRIASREIEAANEYDYRITNRKVDLAVKHIYKILTQNARK